MKNYIHSGEKLVLTAPAGGVSSGDGVQIGQLFVVAEHDAAAGESFTGVATGVHDLPRATGTAWSEGDPLYWDSVNGQVTLSSGSNLPIGEAAADAASADAEGQVRLRGTVPAMFASAEQTGDGTEQLIAHGLGRTPRMVMVTPTDLLPATTGDYTVTEGVHDATHVKVTVTSGKKYKVYAWA